MTIHIGLGPLFALIAGILILLMPRLLNYIVAIVITSYSIHYTKLYDAVSFTILLVTANTMSMAVRERRTEARTKYGAIGIKVWIFKGEVLGKKEKDAHAEKASA